MASQLWRNFCVRMRSLSAVRLEAVSMARRGTAAVASPPAATRHYCVGAGPPPPPKGKIMSYITNNLDVSLGVFITVTANFLYLMDFDGRWARRAAEDKLERERFAEGMQDLKRVREKLEAQLQRLT